jgi:hypothetical protein
MAELVSEIVFIVGEAPARGCSGALAAIAFGACCPGSDSGITPAIVDDYGQ